MNRKSASSWFLFLGLWATIVGVAVFIGHTPDQQTTRNILSTLARVQAGIFAIVFSIVILGVRLSASRYSPRLAKSFSSDSTYRVTVGIFAFSIAINIFGLYVMGAVSDSVLRAVLALSGILAGGSFVSLYRFVNQILERTTPEGMLSHIEEELKPSSMLEEAKLSADDAAHPDPFQTLISVINSTIEEHDRASSALGLSVLGDRVSALIEYDGETEESSPVDKTTEYVCENQLPMVLEQAVDEELTETAIESTETAETIGKVAIEQKSDRGVEHTVRGQAGLVDNLPYETGVERVRAEVIDTSRELIEAAAENQVYTGAAVGARFLGWTASSSIMQRELEDGRNRRYTSLLILHFPKLISKVAGSEVEVNDLSHYQWLRVQNNDRIEEVSPVERLIGSAYGSMAELTSAAIRYEIKTGQQIVDWNSVAHGWLDGLDSLSQMGLDEMAQLWFGTTLYLEYIADESSSDIMDGFGSHGRHRVTSEIGEATVEKIQNGHLNPTTRVDYLPGGVDPIEVPLTGYESPPLQDPERTFREWVNSQPFLFRGRSFGWGEPPTADDLEEEENE